MSTPPHQNPPGTEAAPARRGAAGRLATAWLTQFTVGTDLFVVSPLMPQMEDYFSVSAGAMGLTLTVFSLAYLCTAPLLGRLADGIGRQRVLVAALLLFTLANLATALMPAYPPLVAVRVVAGIAAAGTGPTVYALSSATAPAGRRATHLALVGSGLLSALWAGAPLGEVLGRQFGWQYVFVALALATLLLTLANARVWRGAPGTGPRADAGAGRAGEAGRSARGGPLLVAVTAQWALAVYLLYTFLGTEVSGRGDATALPWTLVAYGVGAVGGSMLGGRLADRIGPDRLATGSLLAAALTEALCAWVFRTGVPWAFALALLCFSLPAYATFPAQQRRLFDRFPHRAGTLMGWNNSALFCGISVSGAVGAPLIHVLTYPGALLAAAAVAALAAGTSALAGARRR
ncbi:MFS transporter [Streptomyces sp. HNM0574]|uniref:MFS transporter n=1 Tax=Streptomyces sp. HNM0574 TaxID=2714954 RepID=UPI00146DAD2D|nr:MFS transporter [Streptomyces sp. HNM0574]NLU69453.1 MFS transporter [Streptomyces sp. HNM0574]